LVSYSACYVPASDVVASAVVSAQVTKYAGIDDFSGGADPQLSEGAYSRVVSVQRESASSYMENHEAIHRMLVGWVGTRPDNPISGSRARKRATHIIALSRLSWRAKIVFGIHAWAPQVGFDPSQVAV
jgi:hypothetical protein